MKKVSEIPYRPGSTTPSNREQVNVVPIDPRIKTLFKSFKAAYGHKYSSTFKTKESVIIALRIWSRDFGKESSETLQACADIARRSLEWPPSVADFAKIVDDHKRNTRLLARPALPKNPTPPEEALEHLQDIRKKLKGDTQ